MYGIPSPQNSLKDIHRVYWHNLATANPQSVLNYGADVLGAFGSETNKTDSVIEQVLPLHGYESLDYSNLTESCIKVIEMTLYEHFEMLDHMDTSDDPPTADAWVDLKGDMKVDE